MPKPIVHSLGPNLTTGSATSHLWIYGENLRQRDTVEIVSASGKTWSGTINKPPEPPTPAAGTLQKARVDVKFNRTSTPTSDDDFAVITVTITNSTESSVPKFAGSIVDGP